MPHAPGVLRVLQRGDWLVLGTVPRRRGRSKRSTRQPACPPTCSPALPAP